MNCGGLYLFVKMKTPFIAVFHLVVAASCNSFYGYHQGILDDLKGSYQIDSVVYIDSLGRDSVLTDAGTFYFAACDAHDNFSSETCDGYYETTAGERTNFEFQLLDDKQLTITPKDSLIGFNLSTGSTLRSPSFERNKDKLRLIFYQRESYDLFAEEHAPQRIILTKQ